MASTATLDGGCARAASRLTGAACRTDGGVGPLARGSRPHLLHDVPPAISDRRRDHVRPFVLQTLETVDDGRETSSRVVPLALRRDQLPGSTSPPVASVVNSAAVESRSAVRRLPDAAERVRSVSISSTGVFTYALRMPLRRCVITRRRP